MTSVSATLVQHLRDPYALLRARMDRKLHRLSKIIRDL
jgi:hypothetical protein